MTERNLMMTLELGRIMHCLLPAFSALLIVLRASLRTDVLTILAVLDGSRKRGLAGWDVSEDSQVGKRRT
jgi:hypothetical protein